ncbi:MAG TPA: alpha/beta fold hydrolase [Croceicoccus sp.]|nr:alpha/beta fold hydrolase [Croceicoccus sp.]
MKSEDKMLDVTDAARIGQGARIAATLHTPDGSADASDDLVFAVHGGGYRRSYWHPDYAGESYSFARWFTDRGKSVLAIDMLGMGESTRPEPEHCLSRAAIAAAHASALDQVLAQMGRPMDVTGVGHSMGGMMIIEQAATHPAFNRVAVLGWTNEPMILGGTDAETMRAGLIPSGYLETPRLAMRALFYADDVPLAIIEADEAAVSPSPVTMGRDALTPGIVHEAAARIAVPVLVVQSVVDTSPAPERELGYFTAAPSVELQLLEAAAHCQNFAGTRERHWSMLNDWIERTRG